jgi:predicted nucleic acid-binding protein
MIRILLDAGPLSRACHPKLSTDINVWIQEQVRQGNQVLVPDIADFEVRRELIRLKKTVSVKRLDALKRWLGYAPISTKVLLHAADLWAEARRKGKPTADPHSLDCDVILAAQAQLLNAIVASENIKHLSLFVDARPWSEIN